MTELVFSPSLSVSQGRPVVSSIAVADHFGKRHANVIRDIRRVASEVSETFSQLNFEFSEYIDETGRSLPMCELSKDGFTIVVMGYTGKEAMARKEAYITRFNEMEAALLNGTHGEPVSIPLTPSTADDRKPLRSLVFAWSRTAGVHIDTCWPQVKAHFQLTRLDDLPAEWIPDALAFVQGKIDEVPKALPESNVTLSREAMDYLIHKKLEEIVDGKINLKDARMAISGFLKAGQIVPSKGQPPVVLMEDQMEERFLELKDAAKDVKLKTNRFMHGVYARVLMVPDDKRNIASRMFVTLDKQWQSINTAIDAMEEHAKAMCCLNRVL